MGWVTRILLQWLHTIKINIMTVILMLKLHISQAAAAQAIHTWEHTLTCWLDQKLQESSLLQDSSGCHP